jgi:predicted Zn finger-like uncharacterized protein
MLLATRCPFCETVFRLLPEQLTLRGGLVRCGHCKQVFDASGSLFDVSNGTSFDKAKPVTIDDVTAYTLETLANSGNAAASEAKPSADARPAPPVVEPAAPVAEPVGGSATRASEAATAEQSTAARVAQAPIGAEARHEPGAQPPAEMPTRPVAQPPTAKAEAEAKAEPEATPAEVPHEPTQDTPPVGSPDFRADAWNPWAPAPDASIDRRIRHSASTIPFNPVTIPRSAQPPLTLELTDSKPTNLDEPISHEPAEPRDEAPAEPAVQSPAAAQDAQAEPKIERPAASPAEAKREPTFEAAPARVLEQEISEPSQHAWREAEHAHETTQVRRDQSANEPKAEPEAPLQEALHEPPFQEQSHDPLHEPRGKSPFESDDGTFMPSAEHHREREPYFGAPSAEPDLEPRFGASVREPFAAAPEGDDDAFAVKREPREREPKRMAWQIAGGVAAGLLGALLLVQLAWWQRETVMVAWPDSQSLFLKACSHLGCKVEPPRDIDGLLVEPSDLRQIDGPHKLELKMPLRNRFDLALAYPAVELTLLDENNNIALRRVLWPQDYVKPGTPIAAGLPARTTQTMIVRLDTGDAVASNFRVQIFYP